MASTAAEVPVEATSVEKIPDTAPQNPMSRTDAVAGAGATSTSTGAVSVPDGSMQAASATTGDDVTVKTDEAAENVENSKTLAPPDVSSGPGRAQRKHE